MKSLRETKLPRKLFAKRLIKNGHIIVSINVLHSFLYIVREFVTKSIVNYRGFYWSVIRKSKFAQHFDGWPYLLDGFCFTDALDGLALCIKVF